MENKSSPCCIEMGGSAKTSHNLHYISTAVADQTAVITACRSRELILYRGQMYLHFKFTNHHEHRPLTGLSQAGGWWREKTRGTSYDAENPWLHSTLICWKMDGRRCHSSNSFLYLLLLWSFFLILVLRLASHSKFNSSNPALPLPLWQLVPSTQGMQITGKFGGRKKQKQQKNEFFPEKFWSIWKITLTDMIRTIFSPFRESLLCATMLLTFAYVREVVLTILAALEFLIGRQQ